MYLLCLFTVFVLQFKKLKKFNNLLLIKKESTIYFVNMADTYTLGMTIKKYTRKEDASFLYN